MIYAFIFGGLLTWWLVAKFIYSPKAQISILWRQIRRISIKVERAKRDMPGEKVALDRMREKSLGERYKMINALIEYFLDPEEDREYIQQNRGRLPSQFQK